jgi:hypothetical protein
MRITKMIVLLLMALPAVAGAQVSFVTVTGSNANYPNGTLTANFNPPANTSANSYSNQRFPLTQSATLNASGVWSLQVADNTTLYPAGSQWQLNLCSQGTYLVAPTCYLVTMPVSCVGNGSCSGSTLNLTSTFAAAPVPPGSGTVVGSRSLSCQPGLGDGLNAIAAGTYLQTSCRNETGATWTLSAIRCIADAGASTCNVTNGAGTALLTGAITGTSTYANGTQSGTTTIAAGDYLKITFVADGTTKQIGIDAAGTY